jgi:superfamily II DNA or RNA helicase/DNA-binding transcriptional MerR regulator
MARVILQDIIDDLEYDNLPANWNTFDLRSFSKSKKLWDYQQTAVTNAIKTLWKYYDDFVDYSPKERPDVNKQRKKKLAQWYRDNGQDENLDIQLSKDYKHAALLGDYYQIGSDDTLSYEQFLNRSCSWMATGSGKTLVIIKLIEILQQLIKRGEIPPNDILILTHRDDLIEHLNIHLTEFNASNSELFIHLRELREYAAVKRDNPSLFKDREATVFYYRSDNLSDEQKEKIIDFRNYDNNGNWYVLLDEAHKGDREDSKRQHIYSILSRNGFLFNFSATFTDPRDLATTACNFNLSEFIRAGYGKHIVILEQEIRVFKKDEDYNDDEKQKIVLKSLILLTYAKKSADQIRKAIPGIYHNPLLLTLVNSVNTEDADLKLFFRELERIGKGKVTEKLWQTAKKELWEELRKRPAYMFEDENSEIDEKSFKSLNPADVLKWIYNGSKPGDIEILIRPSNKQELAFKLKTCDTPFALIKIGDIAGWLKDELSGYEINQSFEDESYFQQLNTDESDINILMGSRSFYEGWDSNRPNVINFINIGTGTDAKKFILQSVGRGVRIEPLKNKRKRLLPLYNAKEVDAGLFDKIKDKIEPLETLFIFGTNKNALRTVIEHLNNESRKDGQQQLSLFLNKKVEGKTLLIPTYRLANEPMAERREPAKFEIATDELDLLKRYVEFIGDDRVLLALHDAEPVKLSVLHESLSASDNHYKTNGRSFKNITLLADRILDYFSIMPEDFDKLKELRDEIRHFRRITVSLKDIKELTQKVETVSQYQDTDTIESELDNKLKRGEITLEEYKKGIKQAAKMVREETVQYDAKRLRIKHLANHYYIPVILSDETERISYIKHIIQERSEIEFINKLEAYLNRPDNKFKDFDWWLFSKLDESLDEVYIPYYSPKSNCIAHFKPDFVFWLQKGKDYFIVFIDPKGTAHTDYQHKIDGYKEIFEEKDDTVRKLGYSKLNTRVFTFLYTRDANIPSAGYKRYWVDSVEKVMDYIALD